MTKPISLTKSLFAVVLAILIAGCSATTPGETTAETKTPAPELKATIEIFAARGQLSETDYEKYTLTGNSLWRECGTMTKKPSIQLKPVDSQADILPAKSAEKISTTLTKLLAIKNAQPLPPPDTPFGISTEGAFELSITKDGRPVKFITSVDAVAGGKSADLRLIQQLFATMRGVGRGICGGGSFFGI